MQCYVSDLIPKIGTLPVDAAGAGVIYPEGANAPAPISLGPRPPIRKWQRSYYSRNVPSSIRPGARIVLGVGDGIHD
jgi:hypothetical protein